MCNWDWFIFLSTTSWLLCCRIIETNNRVSDYESNCDLNHSADSRTHDYILPISLYLCRHRSTATKQEKFVHAHTGKWLIDPQVNQQVTSQIPNLFTVMVFKSNILRDIPLHQKQIEITLNQLTKENSVGRLSSLDLKSWKKWTESATEYFSSWNFAHKLMISDTLTFS